MKNIQHEIVVPIPQVLIDQLAEQIAGKVKVNINKRGQIVRELQSRGYAYT